MRGLNMSYCVCTRVYVPLPAAGSGSGAAQQSTPPIGNADLQFTAALTSGGSGVEKALANLANFPDLPLTDLALDSHLISGGPNAHANATQGLMQHLDGLHHLLQNPGTLSNALRPLSMLPLPGTSMDNPLQSVVIGKTNGAVITQQAEQQQQQQARMMPTTTGGNHHNGGSPALNQHQMVAAVTPIAPPAMMNVSPRGLAAGKTGGSGGPSRAHRAPRGSPNRAVRSSHYRGVTKHKRSGRFESHIWIKELGRQVYLGGYECEEHAAEAYDIAALKSKGARTKTNFELSKYADLIGCIDRMSMEELVMAVRRQSQGFSRGTSSFRGVTHHPSGRWEARIGVPGAKHIYLGLFMDEKEAARAYDRALVRLRGRAAATNFALSDYRQELGDFHRLQGRMLHNDPEFMQISSSAAMFERWIKNGSDAFPDMLSPSPGDGGGVGGRGGGGGLDEMGLDAMHQCSPPAAQPLGAMAFGAEAAINGLLGPAAVAIQQAAALGPSLNAS